MRRLERKLLDIQNAVPAGFVRPFVDGIQRELLPRPLIEKVAFAIAYPPLHQTDTQAFLPFRTLFARYMRAIDLQQSRCAVAAVLGARRWLPSKFPAAAISKG